MICSTIQIDLPSELPPRPDTVTRLVNYLFDRRDRSDPELERTLSDSLTIFEAFLTAFGEGGFDDALSVVVDGVPVYVDVEHKVGDLEEALDGTVKCGALRNGFSILRTTVSRVEPELVILAELRFLSAVAEGQPEATIRVSARSRELALRSDEGPREYAKRVRAFVSTDEQLELLCSKMSDIVDTLTARIRERLSGAKIWSSSIEVRVIAPGARQVGRFRHLGFGATFRPTTFRAIPNYERSGAYDDPHNYHFYSPYHDLMGWIVLGEMLEGRWSRPDVKVLHPVGHVLFTGEHAQGYEVAKLEVARNAVRVDAHGHIVVDDAVPEVAGLDQAEAGTPHSPGWAGEQWADDIDTGVSDVGGEG